jgi:hypothetical protein
VSATISPIAVQYTVAESTTVDDILNELTCLLESARTVLETHTEAIDKLPGGWPALYALRQSVGLLDALGKRLPDTETLEALRAKSA